MVRYSNDMIHWVISKVACTPWQKVQVKDRPQGSCGACDIPEVVWGGAE